MRSKIVALAIVATLAGAVAAQPPGSPPRMGGPPPGIARVIGTVTAASPTSITVRSADGKESVVGLPPGWTLVTARRVDADVVQPGAYVASANVTQPSGDGRAVELRLFEPGAKLGQGNRPMPEVGQMMTNGTVSKVTKSESGTELDVAYPGGVRHIVVPPSVKAMEYFPADSSALTVGATVTALAARADDGTLQARRVSLDPPAT